ncbi:DUF3313 domain-containing protein [Agrobacterium sp. T29]|uniref:DUF3313 domain-containing protein n=1 Tax=Agrobacterium sp. T29 TaxID=2580515 RepID=UPI00115ED561|nr:DUF3313 domain-containing protein [Agrobacterium sp. T29]
MLILKSAAIHWTHFHNAPLSCRIPSSFWVRAKPHVSVNEKLRRKPINERSLVISRWRVVVFACGLIGLVQAGCTSVPLTYTGSLTSYQTLGPVRGQLAKARTFADTNFLKQAVSVAIFPTRISPAASMALSDAHDGALVSNLIDRSLCNTLSRRFVIVNPGEPTDLTIQATISSIVKTQETVAGLSKAITLGTSVVLPVGMPRLPIGMGGLAVEAEATDAGGQQRAAIVWSKGANVITTSARVSEVGDAYGVSTQFGRDFANLLIDGKPDNGLSLRMPTRDGVRSELGGKPKYASCERFGRATGVSGLVGDFLGTPPSWADRPVKQQ